MPKKKLVKKPAKAKKPAPRKIKEKVSAPSTPAPQEAVLLQVPRGMRDILPADEQFWNLVCDKARALAHAFGYGWIETPLLEHKSLYVRGVGSGTDVVQKEMYAFKDQGGDELALRPENTAAAARAYINHGM